MAKAFPTQEIGSLPKFGWRTKPFRDTPLSDQDVAVARSWGESLGIKGTESLLKVLSTLVLPSAGTARVAGLDVVAQASAVRRLIGVAGGDDSGFYWPLSGRDNLEFFGGLRGWSRAVARRRTDEMLEMLELTAVAADPLTVYSAGLLQRLNLARALLGRPSVLLLDEPTRSLDPGAAAGFRQLVRRVAQDEQVTTVVATHDLDEAEQLCDRVGLLAEGTLRAQVSASRPGELAQHYARVIGGGA